MQHFARRQRALDHGAAHLHEHPAIAFQLLHDEAFTAEQTGHHLALEGNADGNALGRRQERILLADQRAANAVQLERQDMAGGGRAKGNARLAAAVVGIHGGEQAFAGEQSLARPHQRAHEAAALAATIAEHGCHADGGILPHHGTGFGHGAFAGIKLDLDELQFMALDLEVDIVGDAGGAAVLPGIGHGSSPFVVMPM